MKDELKRLDCEIAIAGIAATASSELTGAILRKSDVLVIREALEKNVYWPKFCAAVRAGLVPDSWLPGGIGRCVLGWASQEPAERKTVGEQTNNP